MSEWGERDDQIDAYLNKTERSIRYVFTQALSRISDNPSEVVFDILLIDLLDSGMDRIIRELPLRQRALTITRVLPEDAPEGTTRGLEEASQAARNIALASIRELAQEIMTLASRMQMFRQDGFKQAVADLLDKRAKSLATDMNQALLLWDRAVLERIGELKDDPVWVYDGPADSRNRPFCAVIVRTPRAYTREQVEQLNAHPLLDSYVPPNVFMLCGGYNCRHAFLPVSREYARSNGLVIDD